MSLAQTPLQDLQGWMFEALIAPERAQADLVDAAFTPGARLPAAGCLAIYQRSYVLRLRKCLEEQFPACRHALGEDLFADFADEYLRACPSDSYTLYELGRRFPEWLEDSRPDAGEPEDRRETWIDFLVDLAGYELQLYRLFDAPGHEGRPWPGASADDAELILQPCLALGRRRYPVAWYYHEVRAGRAPPFPEARPSYEVILRRDFVTHTYPVTALHHRFLELVSRTGDVPGALETIAAETGRRLGEVRRSWREEVRGPWLEAGFFVARSAGAGAQAALT